MSPSLLILLALAQADVAVDGVRPPVWSGELHLGVTPYDYGGWGDGRRFSTVEVGALLEHRYRWLSAAWTGSLAGDHHQPQLDERRLGLRARLALRLGVETSRLVLRLGPALALSDRGERGLRSTLVPVGNLDLRYQFDCPFYLLLEAGGRGTHATVGEGVHLGGGWRHADGGRVRDTFVSLYVASMVGAAVRLRRQTFGLDYILAVKAGVDLPQVAVTKHGSRLWTQKAFELGFTVGIPLSGPPSPPPPAATTTTAARARPMRHVLSTSLASIWGRTYAAEYEWHVIKSQGLFVEPGWQDRRTAASIRLSGPLLSFGFRLYPSATAPAGFWFGPRFTVGVIRASGWDSRPGPLGPHRDDRASTAGAALLAGFNVEIQRIIVSLGLGPEVTLRGFHTDSARLQKDGEPGMALRLNLGRAW